MDQKLHNLLQNGADPHRIISCPICSLHFINMAQYEAHVRSSKHNSKARKLNGEANFFCNICNRSKPSGPLPGKKHGKRVGVEDEQAENVDGDDVDSDNNADDDDASFEWRLVKVPKLVHAAGHARTSRN
ncbi:hypothetical protein M8C21_031803 [Ambrosia artemisiifolia]|uniref:C2H2-type domain-containing protein n=1 Tax=Ambrosia artemisiifolia TaxID=4212 RepID=A0AAD5CBP2_AMBAR|nr:hypothetical protein M8C21_031803 [Ambrosia artemisiifolia]